MKRRSLLFVVLVALLIAVIGILPAQAKGMPAIFTLEGPGIETPVPFVLQPATSVNQLMNAALSVSVSEYTGSIFDLFDANNQISVDEEQLGEYYIIRGYAVVEDELDGTINIFDDLLTPLYYYPQEDGPGIVKHIGPENVFSEYTNHFYTIGAPLERAIQQTILLGELYTLTQQTS